MSKTLRFPKVLAALLLALCAASALMLAGCGGSDESASSSGAVEEETVAVVDDDAGTTIDLEALDSTLAELTDFYAGQTDAGEYIYYAGGQDGDTAILVYWDTESNEYSSFIGPLSNLGDGNFTVEDEVSGMSMTFAVSANEDGSLNIDMGDELGGAVVSEVSASDMYDAIASISQNATPVN